MDVSVQGVIVSTWYEYRRKGKQEEKCMITRAQLTRYFTGINEINPACTFVRVITMRRRFTQSEHQELDIYPVYPQPSAGAAAPGTSTELQSQCC